MSTMSEQAREAAKSKAERLVRTDPNARVDASGYKPDGPMDAGVQTGMRVLSRRQFRRGGKVDGEAAEHHAGRKPRKSGGRALADDLVNRDLRDANREREGDKHVGGFKAGGRAHKLTGGPLSGPTLPPTAVERNAGGRTGKLGGGALTPLQRLALRRRAGPAAAPTVHRPFARKSGGEVHADAAQDKKLIHEEMHKSGCGCAKCAGGRVGRKDGGGNWMKDAVKRPGAFKAKAKHAGMGTEAFAHHVLAKDSDASTRTKREASLAETFAKERPGHARGGPAINDGTRPTGGRMARKSGGRAKKGTNVNIIITQPSGMNRAPMPAGPPVQAGPPPGLRQGMPPALPPMAMPPPGAGAAPPPMGLMPRARGGRTLEKDGGKTAKPGAYPIETGAGGGLARLEKARHANG